MKLTNIVWIIIGMQILLFVAGLNTSIGVVLEKLSINNPVMLATSFFYTQAVYILGLGAVAVVVIGFFSKGKTENALIAPVALFFLTFIADIVGIISLANETCPAFGDVVADCAWTTWVVVAIMVPLAVVFVMSILDWWRGRD